MDRDNQRPHGILTYDKTGIWSHHHMWLTEVQEACVRKKGLRWRKALDLILHSSFAVCASFASWHAYILFVTFYG
jgi:hypothetical protein